ncbi:peptidoglycan DD-metalloendopeptidase family protein [Candidatus Uhrbacteria bacterium]|nr:peptidoglycan DD-metalloendopeptidase family protein [Candidatus Uhrbacteria bacterium]
MRHNLSGICRVILLLALMSLPLFYVETAKAQGDSDIDNLSSKIDEKREAIDALNSQIDSYKDKIENLQAQEASLYGEIDLLENRIAKTKLDIEAAEASIDLVNIELASLDGEIKTIQEKLNYQRELMAQVLRQIQTEDTAVPLELFFGNDSFSELFDNLERLSNVSEDLKKTVDEARSMKAALEEKVANEETKKGDLVSLEDSLDKDLDRLSEETGSKEILITQTQQSESEFQSLLQDVKQEQTFINQEILLLQQEIEGKLSEADQGGDSSVLSWPFSPTLRGISTYFHDPTYPFRNLFEHSGLDLPAATGTPVGVAATGYVAFTKTGRLYGNYVMVIHTNGLSTLYAHLSRIDVVADQFVARGDTIGAVGSTGLSTGPHLHFEVRKDGIPTDPLSYLISY